MAKKSSYFDQQTDQGNASQGQEGSRGSGRAGEREAESADDRTSAVQKGEGGQKTAEGGARKPGAQRGSIKSEANREEVSAERGKGLRSTPQQ
jgi:hypothetical protein